MSAPVGESEYGRGWPPARVARKFGLWRADTLLAIALGAATFTYLYLLWPRSMGGLDEGTFLYEAKRAVDGEVMYRDFFDLIGPLPIYAMALMYAVFGTSMETARWSMAVLHGVVVVLMYSIARRLDVRPVLAAVVCVTHVALFYPAFPHANQHWISTVLTLILFWFALRSPLTHGGQVFAAGMLTGLIALSQQPKAAGAALAMAIVLVRDAWTSRHTIPLLTALLRRLATFAVGVAAVVVPILLGFVIVAGFERMYEALIYTPLASYRDYRFNREGTWFLLVIPAQLLWRMIASVSPLLVLNVLPCVVILGVARLLWQARRGGCAEQRRPLFVAVVFAICSLISIVYQPNHSHFAITGPIWLSLIADLLETAIRHLERAGRTALAAPLVTLSVLLLLSLELQRSRRIAWTDAGVPAQTHFGLVHFRSDSMAYDAVAARTVVEAEGAKEILVYPVDPAYYLWTQTSNATRFQLLIPGYTTAEQFAEVQQTLERKQVPIVIRTFWFWDSGDPLLPYIQAHYERVRVPRKYKGFPSIVVYRRKRSEAAAPGTPPPPGVDHQSLHRRSAPHTAQVQGVSAFR